MGITWDYVSEGDPLTDNQLAVLTSLYDALVDSHAGSVATIGAKNDGSLTHAVEVALVGEVPVGFAVLQEDGEWRTVTVVGREAR